MGGKWCSLPFPKTPLMGCHFLRQHFSNSQHNGAVFYKLRKVFFTPLIMVLVIPCVSPQASHYRRLTKWRRQNHVIGSVSGVLQFPNARERAREKEMKINNVCICMYMYVYHYLFGTSVLCLCRQDNGKTCLCGIVSPSKCTVNRSKSQLVERLIVRVILFVWWSSAARQSFSITLTSSRQTRLSENPQLTALQAVACGR